MVLTSEEKSEKKFAVAKVDPIRCTSIMKMATNFLLDYPQVKLVIDYI